MDLVFGMIITRFFSKKEVKKYYVYWNHDYIQDCKNKMKHLLLNQAPHSWGFLFMGAWVDYIMRIYKNRIVKIQETANSGCPSLKEIKTSRENLHKSAIKALPEITSEYNKLNPVPSLEKVSRDLWTIIETWTYELISWDIKNRDSRLCMVCGLTYPDKDFHIDHIIPKSKFPCSHPWNLQLLCRNCNMDKGAVLLDMIPIFLKGAKYRTNKYIGNEQGIVEDIIYLGNMKYKTITIEKAEEIIDSIIQEYTAWVDILEFLGTVKHRR